MADANVTLGGRPLGITTPLSVYGDSIRPQDINYRVIRDRMDTLGLNRTTVIAMVREKFGSNARSVKSW